MLLTLPPRLVRRSLPLAVAAISFACSDNPTPLAPHAPTRAKLLEAPVVVVTNTDDAGAGSLRQAIADAPDGASIQFDAGIAGRTIVLTSGELFIDKPLTVEGPVTGGMTVSGGLSSRVFRIGVNGDVIFRNLSIVNGREDSFGGGIFNNGGRLTLDHSLVANNEVFGGKPFGGGIYSSGTGSSLVLVNSTVSGNVGGNGGGINSQVSLTIRNSTITGNSSSQGGGILALGSVSLRNSIVAYNVDRSANPVNTNCYVGTSPYIFLGLNITNDNSCGTDPALLVTDWLLLGQLANNGGPTMTHALQPGTPAIDGGIQCTEATDQRYVARPQGSSCDVGAFEFNDYAKVTLVPGPNAAVSKTGVMTLGGTISCTSPGTFPLNVSVSQTQKTTGKFTTIVQAAAPVTAYCNGTSSWSVALTPQTGGFENGAATATVETTSVPVGFLPASTTSSIKVYTVK
jgi:hypothetical protein